MLNRHVYLVAFFIAARAQAANPGCEEKTVQQCVSLALDAMGGRELLQQVKNVRLQTVGHTLLTEQSYRQEPFLTSYEHSQETLDFTNSQARTDAKVTWPEADPNQVDSDSTLIAGLNGCVTHSKDSDAPCPLSYLSHVRQALSLGPERLLLTASAAPNLHFEAPETVRSSSHAVVAFSWQNVPVRILLNPFNHLPDAIETTQVFNDFWYFWGDVHQRIYLDNWKLVQGVTYPTNLVEERNGIIWSSRQALDVAFNVSVEDKFFAMDPAAAKRSAASPGWNRPFRVSKELALAPGVTLFPGAWNSTIVKQSDGIVILEAPISGLYTQGVIEEAKKRNPGLPIKAVLSTSDSWPHVGGVRFAVAQGLPVYILDLNQPLLDRVVTAPHKLAPDALEINPKRPDWRIVSGKQDVGSGANRIELYPLRGASTERQYMAYFPDADLLYESDTLALNEDGTFYDPELMREVAEAVKRANLKVETVFAMHQGPMPWSQVITLLARSASAPGSQSPQRP